jgi:hypothetical protein
MLVSVKGWANVGAFAEKGDGDFMQKWADWFGRIGRWLGIVHDRMIYICVCDGKGVYNCEW